MRTAPALCLVLALPLAAQGYTTDFETLVASPGGTSIIGQDGYYLPPVAGSVGGSVYTYAGNTIVPPVPANPTGGLNFYGGHYTTAGAVVRSQRNVTPPTASRCRIEFDVLCNYTGTATAAPNNIGSFSLQPSSVIAPQFPTAAAYPNLLARWPVTTLPVTVWAADYVAGPSLAGTQTAFPDPNFRNLPVNVWHRWGVTIDLRTKEYLSFSVYNGATATLYTYTPAPPIPLPNQAATYVATDFRLFTGALGNLFAVDNFTITYGATYDSYGAGCAGSLGVPTLAAAPGSVPALGSTFTAVLGNLPLSVGVMASGFSDTLALGAIPLPLDLSSYGFPGCSLLADPLVTEFLVGAGNSASWTLGVPASTGFLGMPIYQQGISLDTGSPAGAFSNGAKITIGLP